MQKDTGRYATSQKLVACLTSTDNLLTTDTTLSYVAPTERGAGQAGRRRTPELKVWVDAVKAAKGRTSDNLGTKYPKISEPMWKAVQAALSGSKSPQAALAAQRRPPSSNQDAATDEAHDTAAGPPAGARPERGGDRRPASGPHRDRRRPASQQWAAWAFLAPVDRLPGRSSTPTRSTATST